MRVFSATRDLGFYATSCSPSLFSGYRDILSKAEPDTYFHFQGWHWQVHDLRGNTFSYLEKKHD